MNQSLTAELHEVRQRIPKVAYWWAETDGTRYEALTLAGLIDLMVAQREKVGPVRRSGVDGGACAITERDTEPETCRKLLEA